jgi:hypothetical protein
VKSLLKQFAPDIRLHNSSCSIPIQPCLSKLDATEAYFQGSHESWVKNIKECLKARTFTGVTNVAVVRLWRSPGWRAG